MKNIMRKHLWPAALVAALAVVGMLAAFVVLAGPERGTVEAQSACETLTGPILAALIEAGQCPATTPAASPSPTTGGGGAPGPVAPGATAQPGATTPPGQTGPDVCSRVSGNTLAGLIAAGFCPAPTATPEPTTPPTVAPTSTPTGSAPVAVNEINDVSLLERSADTMDEESVYTAAIDVSDNFSDDGTLTYTARSSNAARATVAVAGSRVTVTGVAPGSATVTVTATDTDTRTATQRFRVTVLNDDRPSVPRNARAYPLDNAITLRWSTPLFRGAQDDAAITGYRITRTVASDSRLKGKGGDAVINVDASTYVYRDQGLSYNEFYTYQVRALNNSGPDGADAPGVASAPLTYRTAESGGRIEPETRGPSSPTDVTLRAACDDSIMVTWTAPSDPGLVRSQGPGSYIGPDFEGGRGAGIEIQGTTAVIEYYRVERRVGNGNWRVIAPMVRGTSHVDPGNPNDDDDLSYGSTYSYRVTARNNVPLYSEPSAAASVSLSQPAAPNRPTSLVAVEGTTAEGGSAVELQWDPPVDPPPGSWRVASDVDPDTYLSRSLSYRIQRKIVPPNTAEDAASWVEIEGQWQHRYAALDEDSDTRPLDTTRTQNYLDDLDDVATSGRFAYRVAAQIDLCVWSDWVQANEVEINLPLGAPSRLSATPGVDSVTLRWTRGSSSTKHWVAGIKQSDWDAGDYSNVIWVQASSDSTHTVTGLDSGAEYVFTVAAGRGEGSAAEWSSWATPLARATPN